MVTGIFSLKLKLIMEPVIKQDEKGNMFAADDNVMIDLCIVCCAKVKAKANCTENKDHLLSSNLSVIFLLRNLLQVPDSQLEENLKEFGDPLNWIRLCEQCSQLTRQAEELHWLIVKSQEQLRSVQQLILDKAKVSSKQLSSSSLSIDKTEGNGKKEKIWRNTRDFIKTCNYNACTLVNPFIEGDKLANDLTQQYIFDGPEQPIKVEVDNLDDDDDELYDRKDTEWEPPPEVDDSEEDQHFTIPTSTSKTPPSIPKGSRKQMKIRHKQLNKSCHLCSREYVGQYELIVHLLFRHKNDPKTLKLAEEKGYQLIKCGYPGCTVVKVKQTLMDKHIKRMHSSDNHLKPKPPPKRFPCQFCTETFSRKDVVLGHQSKVHKDKIDKLSENGKDKQQLIRKVCHLCGQTCSGSSNWKKHLFSKHREEPLTKQLIERGYGNWRCKVIGCGYKYTTQKGLDKHVDKVHGGKDKVEMEFFCQFCGKGFYAEDALRRHERSIHGDNEGEEKRFKCEFCGFGTQFQSYLDGHIKRVHKPNKKFGGEVKGDKVVICTVCGLQFWEKGKLGRHMVIHDKGAEQPFPCDKCGRAFSTNESMWKHKRKVHRIYRRPDDSRIKK